MITKYNNFINENLLKGKSNNDIKSKLIGKNGKELKKFFKNNNLKWQDIFTEEEFKKIPYHFCFYYEYVGVFSEGMAQVRTNDKYGSVDEDGNIIIPIKYDYVGDYSEGKVQVRLDGKWGFFDSSGEIVIPYKFDYVNKFKNGKSKVKLNGDWSHIDENGVHIKEYWE